MKLGHFRFPLCGRKDETDSSVDASDTDETDQDIPVRLTQKAEKRHRRERCTDDVLFPSEQLKNDINS